MVEEVRFPKLGGNPDFIRALFRREIRAGNEDPVLGLVNARRILGVDAHAQRGTPDEVLDEMEPAVRAGEDPRARALEALRRRYLLIGQEIEFHLRHAIGPDNARDPDLFLRPQAEMRARCNHRCHGQQCTGADFDPTPKTETVDPAVRTCA